MIAMNKIKTLILIGPENGGAYILIKLKSPRFPDIILVALISDNYHPKENTIKYFDNHIITWSEVANIYSQSFEIFQRANNCYQQ